MNIGSSFSLNEGVDSSQEREDDEKKRQDAQQVRKRIARKAAELERLQRDPESSSIDAVPRPQQAWQVLEAIVQPDAADEPAVHADELDALLRQVLDEAPVPPQTEVRPRATDEHAAVPEQEAPREQAGADVSPRLSQALGELREIQIEIDGIETPQGHAADLESMERGSAATAFADAPSALDTETDGGHRAQAPARERDRDRLEARLAFIEGFYADLPDGQDEQQQLQLGIAKARAALQSPAQRPASTSPAATFPRNSMPELLDLEGESTMGAMERDKREAHALDVLVTRACDAIATGAATPALLGTLAAQFAQSRVPAAAPSAAAGVSRAQDGGRAASSGGPAQALEALRSAAEGMHPNDARKALLESFLNAQDDTGATPGGTADALDGAAEQRDAATQRLIDSRHANDSLPLAALRVL